MKDSRGILWIGTGGGLCRFDGEKFITYNTSHGLVGDNVYAITEDSRGDLWIGSMAGGISRFDGTVFHNYTTRQGLVSDQVRMVWYSRQHDVIMVGTSQGCSALKNGRFINYLEKDEGKKIRTLHIMGFLDGEKEIRVYGYTIISPFNFNPDSEKYSEIPAALKFSSSVSPIILDNGDTVAGIGRSGIVVFGKNGATRFEDVIGGQVFGMSDDHKGSVWVAGWTSPLDALSSKSGLFRYDYRNQIAERFDRKVGITDRSVWTTFYDTLNSILWVGTLYEGLYKIPDPLFSIYDTTFPGQPQNKPDPSLDREKVWCADHRGNIISVVNDGLLITSVKHDKTRKPLHRITAGEGLVGNNVSWLIVDKNRKLYAGTNKGLNIIDLEKLYLNGTVHLRFFDKDKGYVIDSANRVTLDGDGNIWVINAKKALRIETGKPGLFSSGKNPIIITAVEVNNSPFLFPEEKKPNHWTGEPLNTWIFETNENMLTFYFGNTDFAKKGDWLFRYRLQGLMSGWSRFSQDPKAVFTNLEPGKYTLQVEGHSRYDNMTVSTVEYRFSIRTPWYATWWFIVVAGSVALCLGIILYRLRIRRVREREHARNELLLDISKLEMQALQAQMKPHFIFNAINSMQSYILSNDVDKALYYLNMFSKLIRKTLENASKEFIPLAEELSYLTYYLEIEKMRFSGLFDYEMLIPDTIPVETTMIPPMIVQLFIENSIKHGLSHNADGGMLIIELSHPKPYQFCLVVQDNGIGRKRATEIRRSDNQEHHSMGLHIVKERIRILNETHGIDSYKVNIVDLENTDGTPAGVRAEFWFPEVEATDFSS